MSEEEARDMADRLGMLYVETSALTGAHVTDAFYYLAFAAG